MPIRLMLCAAAIVASYLLSGARGIWPAAAAAVLLLILELWRRRPVLLWLLLPTALAFGFGLVPGFIPVSDYTVNTGKALLGVMLLLYLPLRFAFPWRDRLFQLGALGIPLITLALAWTLGFLHWQPIALSALLAFTVSNVFSTLAEEAVFRGLVQAPLRCRLNRWSTLVIVSILFGLVHLGGGAVFAAFATLAGFGYALTYERSQSLWAAVLVHLGLNIVRVVIGG